MSLKAILTIVTSIHLVTVFGQEPIYIKQTKVSEAIAFEKSLNPKVDFFSKNITLSTDYYPSLEKHRVVNPIIFQREPLDYLPLSVEYYYTPDDSIIRFVSYEWEKDKYGNYFNKMELWKEEHKKFKQYNKEYERIKQDVINQFGIPASTDSAAKEQNSEGQKYYTRESTWQTETLQIRLWMIFASNTYRIRMSTYWKNN